MTETSFTGFNDEPTEIDSLNINAYIAGFREFIKSCPTPMTAAIQGDWGSGKTSALKRIKKKLDGEGAQVVEFNTWQYSQFNLGEQLVFSLLGGVLSSLEKRIDSGKEGRATAAKEKITKLRKALIPLALASLKVAGYGVVVDAADAMKERIDKAKKKDAEASVGSHQLIEIISTMRDDFQALINEFLKFSEDTGKCQSAAKQDRIFIFIDDLDRLEPERAVEVMEALKVFMNVKGCVFVLAIDFEVVLRGVRAKYGQDFDEGKARDFFDKIIQVP
ncbi:hypothetical protein HMPREF1627_00045, partial [Actinomyces sp. S6-Spd3]